MSRLISLFLTLLLGATSPTYANEKVTNVGSVTIDGIPIPELHYQVYADRFIYDSKLICPPVSDAFIRDQVIGVWLRHSQGLKDGSISDDVKRKIEENNQARDNDTNLDDIGRTRYDLTNRVFVSNAAKESNEMKINPTRVVEHYQRMIENQHPGLVKVALIRAYELKLYDDNEVEIASELANTNNSILDIAEELNMAHWIKYQADEWYALNSRDYRLGNVDGIELGKVYGPFKLEYETYFVQVEEVKLVSRLRPSIRVNTDWKYAINYAESDLNFQQRYGGVDPYLDTLWDSHTVLLDGEPLKKTNHYPNCLDQ